MYLNKLEILGFKSFGRKTAFIFNSGITSIVGPNGCGKSNIVDAIRWVLGEQKAGTLRSERMENVIFNGTKTIKPLGMAEVSLTVKNTRNILSVDYTDVVITRRLFRSGESQYLLNNSICRLKDILDLFMDTGMGPDAYSVIELSMVESILNGKAEERRKIFEQAAGISKYKLRRRVALRKLEATEKDLVRVEDIISEVQKNVDSLQRQVRKARRHQELAEQLKNAEIQYATIQYFQLLNELKPLQANYELLKKDLNKLSTKITLHESEVEALQTQLVHIEQKLSTAQEKLDVANKTIYKKEEEIAISRERFNATDERNQKNSIEKKQLEERLTHLQKQKDETTARISTLQKEIADVEAQYDARKAILTEFEERLEQKRSTSRDYEEQHLQLIDKISDKSKENERLQFQLEHQTKRIQELTNDATLLKDRIQTNESNFQKIKEKISLQTNQLERQIVERDEIEKKISSMLNEAESLKEVIFLEKSQVEDINNKSQLLRRLIESYEDYPEGVRNLLLKQKEQGFLGTFADVISVADKYRLAIESFLGEATAFVLTRDISFAFKGIDYLIKNEKGIVTFIPLQRFMNAQLDDGITIDPKTVPGFIGYAHDLVECDQSIRPIVNTLLKTCIIVEDIMPIRQMVQQTTNGKFSFVSLSGDLISGLGAIKGGRKSDKDGGPIGRRDQLNQLESKKEQLINSIDEKEKRRERIIQEIERLSLNQKSIAGRIKELEKGKTEAELELRQKQFEQDKYKEELDKNTLDRDVLEKEGEAVRQRLVSIKPEIEQAEKERQQLKSNIQIIQKELANLEKETSLVANEVHALNLEVVSKKGEFNNAEQEIARNVLLAKEYQQSIEAKRQEIETGSEQKEKLQQRMVQLNNELETDFNAQDELEQVVQKYEAERGEIARKVGEINRTIRGLRFDREKVSEKLHGLELHISELKLKSENIQQNVKEEYDVQLKEEKFSDETDIETLERAIESIKRKIHALGPINLLALKEYEKEKERLNFLTEQQTDLFDAKKNLMDTLTVINHTARTKFQDVYKLVRNNFAEVFKSFFPEGEADLVLTDDRDLLESELEIVATPKGRRLGSLALLSGGEKTLTAISLLFAIYLVKPSPFCILDEVDAPLDDTNIERFTKAIRTFSDNTQFIIVTHNKLTMKAADCLYGITMLQDGISKVVSVKMEHE